MENILSLQNMRNILKQHPVISHKFLMDFSNGNFTKEQIKFWLEQQFFLSVSFPDALGFLFSRIPFEHIREKRKLAEMLLAEARGSGDPDSHEAHFKKLALFFGLDADSLLHQKPKNYTQNFIQKRTSICLEKSLDESLAAIAIGNEILNLHIFQAYTNGIRNTKGLENCPTAYFDVHLRDEIDDFNILNNAFLAVSTNAKNIEKTILEISDARHVYFDKLLKDMSKI